MNEFFQDLKSNFFFDFNRIKVEPNLGFKIRFLPETSKEYVLHDLRGLKSLDAKEKDQLNLRILKLALKNTLFR